MLDQKRSKQILKSLALDIENDKDAEADSTDPADGSEVDAASGTPEFSASESRSLDKKDKSSSMKRPSLNDLKRQKGKLNLEERKKLLNILKMLFSIQLIFMNVVVLLIVCWCIFEIPFLRTVNQEILTLLVDLSKYYVTAVLVELLGGIIYIVHNVFSDKTIDRLDS